MKETGNILKSARLQQNITLEEIAQATKIKVQTLIALEEGDLSKLPKKAFIRGFVRTYAGYLKLNTTDLLDSFHKEMGSTQKHSLLQSNDSLSGDPAVQFANSKRNPFTRGLFVGAIVAIVIVIYMTSRVIQKYQDEKIISGEVIQVDPIGAEDNTTPISIEPDSISTTDAIEPTPTPTPTDVVTAVAPEIDSSVTPAPISTVAPTPKPTVAPTPKPTVAPTPKPTVAPTPKPTVAPTPKPTVAPTPKPTVAPTPKPTVAPTPKPTIAPTPKPTITPTPKPTVAPTPKPTIAPTPKPTIAPTPTAAPVITGRPQEIIVEALDKVEIQFSTDGEKLIKVKLAPEQIYTIKAQNTIQLKSSDGGAINLIYNGRDQGVPGTLGEKVERKFPR